MARTTRRELNPVNPAIARIDRRIWPLAVSIAYIILGLVYEFRWGPVVRHVPSLWIAPGDLLSDYGTAIQFAQGHFSNVYAPGRGFLSYPGLLVALLPLAALNGAFKGHWINVKVNGVAVAHPQVFIAPNLPSGFWYQGNLGPNVAHGTVQTIQPQAYPFLIFLALLYSCFALFACDALAERLQVGRSRRAVLALVEAAVLWNVTIIFGHPEDAVAVAFAIYALIFAMDERFVGAAWLFGLALAFQPLALVTLPILLAIAGRKRALGIAVRGAVPAAVVTAPPLVASIHNTFHALVTQPTFPDVSSAHQTPWTFLAPKMGGTGKGTTVGGGLPRIMVLVVATAWGWWSRHFKERPEMLAWAVAVAFSIRVYLETVMYSYYIWPVLAVALVVAARATRWRFAAAISLAVLTTVIGQWHMGWVPWWIIDVCGITGLLVAASRPEPVPAGPVVVKRVSKRSSGPVRAQTRPVKPTSGPLRRREPVAASARANGAKKGQMAKTNTAAKKMQNGREAPKKGSPNQARPKRAPR